MANQGSQQSSPTVDKPGAINPLLAIVLLVVALLCGAVASEIISPWFEHRQPAELTATKNEG